MTQMWNALTVRMVIIWRITSVIVCIPQFQAPIGDVCMVSLFLKQQPRPYFLSTYVHFITVSINGNHLPIISFNIFYKYNIPGPIIWNKIWSVKSVKDTNIKTLHNPVHMFEAWHIIYALKYSSWCIQFYKYLVNCLRLMLIVIFMWF